VTSAAFAYDEVPYDTEANADTHPNAMGVLGRLFGLRTALPSRCRVLEIGCGDGENLLAMASYLPNARFVGFDLAERAIARGRETAAPNVELLHADVREARGLGAFDYVIAHGFYSWVPEPIREAALAAIRGALAPGGVAFLSFNALPGWELRRALRLLARHATASIADPAVKVERTLALATTLGELGGGFLDPLSATARGFLKHVEAATPEGAPFSRYVFHDLLADCNDPFSVADVEARASAAGLRLVCEAPLVAARVAPGFPGLARHVAASGAPFLQVLLCRDDEASPPSSEPDPGALRDLFLWADLRAEGPGVYRTTSGARVRPEPGDVFTRAAAHAPGFVAVKDLGDHDASAEVLAATCVGALRALIEPPRTTPRVPELPAVAPFVRARAARAIDRGAPSAVLTSALHASFDVPYPELLVVRELDGAAPIAALGTAPPRLAGDAALQTVGRLVASVLERFARYAFLVETP
jgi:SAM-dependent methyltransferase